ncbi:nicotinate phosphoribosyltransferase [Streptomyces sp. TS71-3]|uniref:nicotinate phosphoribosyltransferase n=1 Tax=Streptomyces sp. TS71-3 TaxID=2733862 RepID=UPI001B169822|nr:nicotinate phosphoribosyltransferase [Streptomyces sp. TS71-3]GHJ39273.1 nicotinate phosphoribosyltransferase [Streptomyces sp. TS71-3]
MPDATTTDLYEATMALSYLEEGLTAPATFSLFVRDLPPERGFLVAAGLESALDYLADFRVGRADTEAYAAALYRSPEDLRPLVGLGFTGEVRAVPEGRTVLADEPLLEVTAPLPEAQMVETCLLNMVSHQTLVASKAARCVLAAEGKPVVDFSLRRTQGIEAGMQAARLGALVGFAGTSNVSAALAHGLRARGTMAHSYIEAFPDEESAFRAFARAHPGPMTFLVDTYDTREGVATAIRVMKDLGLGPDSAVRLDSGDLGELARLARRMLDGAGLPEVLIVASGGLDEYQVADLVRAAAPIDVYAVGTRVGVSADAPYLDSAYKLTAYDGRPVMKLSSAKVTAPGAKQVFRTADHTDVIALRDEEPPDGGHPLLETVMAGGRRTHDVDPLARARERFGHDAASLPEAARRIRHPEPPRPGISEALWDLTEDVHHRIERENLRQNLPA